MTKIGIACKGGRGEAVSGDVLARKAMESGGMTKPDLIFAFCSGKSGPEAFFHGIRKAAGNDVPIVGGSAIGVISSDFLCYTEPVAGVMAISSDLISFRVASAGDIDRNERKAGRKVAADVAREPQDKLLLVFYDSIKSPPDNASSPPIMNSSTPLIAAIGEVLADDVPLIGAGLIGDYDFNRTVQFCGSSAGSQCLVGLMLSGDFSVYHRITHGCTPLDGVYHRVTKASGPLLYEIDGRPIVETINELFDSEEWQEERPLDFLTIGVHCGERYGGYKENQYVNRLILGVIPDRSGVVMFESDLKTGDEIQFMVRDAGRMVESARDNSRHLVDVIRKEGKIPVLAMYIDCAGRAKDYSNTSVEEGEEVQKVLKEHDIPLFGFYSGVELAPLLGRTRGLDWTGVLTILARNL
ncbi:MAG: FIST N-terminal domain-containing protein [Syntrophorhabdaceae bacterium]|nr:FIST N-terminal domain-containing protein [Syntrophorhabdaceae bacterium]